MFTIISFFRKLIKGGVEIRAGVLENFSKINKRGGTIIRYSRVAFAALVAFFNVVALLSRVSL